MADQGQAGDTVTEYICWCDGTACDGRTTEPFTVCDECKRLGHRPMPSDGYRPEHVAFDA